MAENYNLSTEVDPNSRITVTSASQIDYSGITRNESAYRYFNKGVGFYATDFRFDVDVNITSDTGGAGEIALSYPWAVGNSIENAKAVIDNLGQLLCVEIQSAEAPVLVIAEYYNGTRYATVSSSLSYGVDYYPTIRRDESVGTYGTLYLDIYTDSARDTLLETISVTLHAKVDFQYLYAFNTYNDAVAFAQTGVFKNLIDYQDLATENYNIYTETDPNSRLAIASATRIDYAGIARNESAYIHVDRGANYYAGNFEFDVDVQVTAHSGASTGLAYPWGVSNSVNDARSILVASGTLLCVELQSISSTLFHIVLAEYYGGTRYAATAVTNASQDTFYYLKTRRDESVGAYGTLYLDVYSDIHRETLVGSASLALHALVDFQYLYAFNSYNDGNTYTQTGLFQNLVDYQPKIVTETGNGTDSVSVSAAASSVNITDSGYGGDEVSSVIAAITVGDTGAGSDTILVYSGALYSVADSGSGIDTLVSLAASLAITDNASGADSIYISGIVTPDIILESCHGFAAGYEGQVEYRIVDEYRQIIEDWTAAGVFEVPEDGTTSSYSVKIGRLSQYTIFWRIPGTRYKARRTVNLFESNNDAQTSSRLAAADFIAPDNAGISILLTDTALLIAFIKNKKYLEKTGATWYLVIRDAADSADILRKALKGPDGTTEITDITAAAMGLEVKSSV